ncbi:pilus assembly protein PilP [Legionella hackeliae]|uniref:Tfp pilus assembly protein PilP n=2 Tax=Legionella hackeliae TaxID=449 RepID=A0A0A8UUL4_LEGHA|nr:pilus assembly protein PilP [Legionella hackeliae]KTD15439.1 type IV pilus biogenesis protein PilP [Legionella hackeliae]CEK11191.1 protein of unknown function [Legionella hackeliae]STX47956.1 type IV pilus biogenesis protein PilP [Legionella hackeliae]
MLVSCGASDNDLFQYIQRIKSRKTLFQGNITVFKSLKKFNYPVSNKRNPFIISSAVDKQNLEENYSREFRQFIFNSLKFVGSLQSNSKSWVLVKEPNGKISVVKPGDCIGKENIELVKINNEVLLFRTHFFSDGKWQQKIVRVRLGRKAKG